MKSHSDSEEAYEHLASERVQRVMKPPLNFKIISPKIMAQYINLQIAKEKEKEEEEFTL